ncbi:ferric reductase-like transmembrane domain-containing protein [Mesorhizobium loti]|uniref:ferric reductase-like transmembrane domain-containing protein n=1 Tax=Rhizobium loti TaxID=381 RepID=UPI000422C4BA|nr:ferric reductase-like transmembrane domain-containing protein [Mesorhizobium loti]
MDIIAPPLATRATSRWRLFWLLAAIILALSVLVAFRGDFSVEAVREVVRLTAQMSLLLFCTAFSASALSQRWPSASTLFLRRHRRQIGLAFAFSHGVHAVALVIFSRIDPGEFSNATDTPMFVFGGLAYLFIIAMVATSFDRTAAWLGPRAWRILHSVGSYDIWLTFLIAEGKRAPHDVYYWPYVALLVAVMVIRWRSRKTRAAAG